MKYQAILFDYGGTLDTAGRHWANVLWEGYIKAGVRIEESLFREAYVYAERYLATHPVILPEDDFATLLRKKVQLEADWLIQRGINSIPIESIARYCDSYASKTISGIRPLLERISHTYTLVLVTNFYGNIRSVLQSYELLPYFKAIVESATAGVRKPDPAIWQKGVEATGCEPAQTIAIGDSFEKDILPASECGCHTIWYKGEEWKTTPHDETIPDFIIHNLAEMEGILRP